MRQRRLMVSGTVLCFSVLVMAGCTFFGKPVGEDKARAVALEKEIADYKKWQKPDLWEDDFYKSKHPVPEYVSYYVNKIAAESMDRPVDGAVFVKEQFNKNKELINFTVMKKIKGYDPENKDWFWAIADKKGRIIHAGKLNSVYTSRCIDCHKKGDGGGDLLFVND